MSVQFLIRCRHISGHTGWKHLLDHFPLSFDSLLRHVCKLHTSNTGLHHCTQYRMASVTSSSSYQSKSKVLDGEVEATCSSYSSDSSNDTMLNLNKVAVIGKMTRYEFERQRYEGCTEEQFKERLTVRGSNYNTLLEQHKKHIQTMTKILDILKKRGIQYRICNRGDATHSKNAVEWADAVITAGGDGTFLSAASKIKTKNKPVIGINTDPLRSEGHLCLPAQYSSNFDEALDKIVKGRFRWLYRQRIRITMTGSDVNFKPIDNGSVLQDRMRGTGKHVSTYFSMNDSDDDSYLLNTDQCQVKTDASLAHRSFSNTLPTLALNEVFIGESLSSVPSYYELQVDGGVPEKQKSSGICISTGTGSTAWSYNICRLHHKSTQSLLQISRNLMQNNNEEKLLDPVSEERLVREATEIYGRSFMFDANEEKMLYSIRDPMQNKVYRCENPHGFAKSIMIRSRCWDAALCIDGDTSFVFNDGATAFLQVLPEDALKTIILEET